MIADRRLTAAGARPRSCSPVAGQFGMTPSARARISAGVRHEPRSKFGDLLRGDGAVPRPLLPTRAGWKGRYLGFCPAFMGFGRVLCLHPEKPEERSRKGTYGYDPQRKP